MTSTPAPDWLARWRKSRREALVAVRMAVAPHTLSAWRLAMDATIKHEFKREFPVMTGSVIAFCWPFQNEYDARHVAAHARSLGARTALPVVVAPRTPLEFREWHPGVELAVGVYDIPYPAASERLEPDFVLLPMNGFDVGGFRLGYGGGFFDRTLAAIARRPIVVGVTFEMAAIATIHPQPYDIPMDYVVTERGVYRRVGERLVFG